MKITYKLKKQYIDEANNWFQDKFNIKDAFWSLRRVAEPICHAFYYSQDFVYIKTFNYDYYYFTLSENYEDCKKRYPWAKWVVLPPEKYELLRSLKDIDLIPPIKKWNEIVKLNKEHKAKIKQIKQNKAEVALMFDDEIRMSEINKMFEGFYVRFKKTKFSLHCSCGYLRYYRHPICTFKIKMVKMNDETFEYTYNKKEFIKVLEENKETLELNNIRINIENMTVDKIQ